MTIFVLEGDERPFVPMYCPGCGAGSLKVRGNLVECLECGKVAPIEEWKKAISRADRRAGGKEG